MSAVEVNFDGLVGPTHHYGGLGYGNLAAQVNKLHPSNPRAAALEGLEKMRILMERGFEQCFVPPQIRPDLKWLAGKMSFKGDWKTMLAKAYQECPSFLSACYSASSMWTANMATVSPSADTRDGRVHFTPANLDFQVHRSLEKEFNSKYLRWVFPSEKLFKHHLPLDSSKGYYDEGAANYCRLTAEHGKPGYEIFVYGNQSTGVQSENEFIGRQSLSSSREVAAQHCLERERVLYFQQNPESVRKGVFHNDVISLANENVFLYHEEAFVDFDFKSLKSEVESHSNKKCFFIQIKSSDLSVEIAVQSYLFNSQLLTYPDGHMLLLAPQESKESPEATNVIESILDGENPVTEVEYLGLKQSMRNGGGPACLRLRVVLTQEELHSIRPEVRLTPESYLLLKTWIKSWYRDRLTLKDLSDPQFAEECFQSLTTLGKICGMENLLSIPKYS